MGVGVRVGLGQRLGLRLRHRVSSDCSWSVLTLKLIMTLALTLT